MRPLATINGIIYVGGASDYQGGTVVDTTTSFSFDPLANTIGTIAAIPRATGETRGLNFNGRLYVIGGGRVAPNPSNEVDIYNPGTNTWSTGLPFGNARRNFPTDTDGTTHIWLSGGYDVDGITPLGSMEIFCQGGGTPTPTPTATQLRLLPRLLLRRQPRLQLQHRRQRPLPQELQQRRLLLQPRPLPQRRLRPRPRPRLRLRLRLRLRERLLRHQHRPRCSVVARLVREVAPGQLRASSVSSWVANSSVTQCAIPCRGSA